MSGLTDNLDSIAERIRQGFSGLDIAREKVLPLCREAIRHCNNAIRALHRQEFDNAEGSLKSARKLLGEIKQAVSDHSELRATGFVRDAQKEYAEGSITLALVTGKQPPTPDELGITPHRLPPWAE
jgi:translin